MIGTDEATQAMRDGAVILYRDCYEDTAKEKVTR